MTLQEAPRLSRAARWALAILVGFRLASAGWLPGDESVNQGYLRRDIAGAADALATYHADETAAANVALSAPARVVFMGSSRFNSAVLPERWAALEGLEPGQILNLSVNRGDLWDQQYILKRAGGLPPSVDLVVLELESYMFNRNRYNSATGDPSYLQPQFLRWADLEERAAVDAPLPQRVAALGHWAWPVFLRQPASTWAVGWLRGMPVRAKLPEAPVYHDDPELAAKQSEDPVFAARNMSLAHNHALELSETSFSHLDALIAQLRLSETRIALVVPPIRAAYLETLLEDSERGIAYEDLLDKIRLRAVPGVQVLIWERVEALGLDESVFVDYGHFNKKGATVFTEALHAELETGAEPE